jgi:predicted GNAT family N-acyltransferase
MPSLIASPIESSTLLTHVVDYHTHCQDIHTVRQSVFVNEQAIPQHLEMDAYDPLSDHVLAWWNGQAVGTGRLAPTGRIGRVAVQRSLRRRGIGLQIMTTLLQIARQQRHTEVFLAAQLHAVQFYQKLGFQTEGAVFSELGICHVTMRKSLLLGD